MSFKFEVNFENDHIQAEAHNCRSNQKEKALCHEFEIANVKDQNSITVLPGKVCENFLFGPACELITKSVIYPCNRYRCRVPCPCQSCRKLPESSCGKPGCACAGCKAQFSDHQQFHRVLHVGCPFCSQLIHAFPFFNFWFLNSSKRLYCASGEECETFTVMELVKNTSAGINKPNPSSHLIFLTKDAFSKHVEELEKSGYIFHCHECAHHFKLKEQLLEHISLNHMVSKKLFHLYSDVANEESNFQCYNCNVKKKDKQSLTRHVMNDHYEYKETFSCDLCGNTYTWKSHLVRHVKSVHQPLDRHACTYCGKSFGREENLTVHIQSVHEDGQIFECNKCDSRFNRKNNLERHVQSSSYKDGSSKYQCDKCVKICCTGKQLKTHIGTEHDVIVNDCLFCGELFPLKHHLQRHIEARKPVKCSFCEKLLCNQIGRNKHEESQHEQELNELLKWCIMIQANLPMEINLSWFSCNFNFPKIHHFFELWNEKIYLIPHPHWPMATFCTV